MKCVTTALITTILKRERVSLFNGTSNCHNYITSVAGDFYACGAMMGVITDRKTEVFEQKSVPVPLCP